MFDVFPTTERCSLLSDTDLFARELIRQQCVLENASSIEILSSSGKRPLILDNPSSYVVLVNLVEHSWQAKVLRGYSKFLRALPNVCSIWNAFKSQRNLITYYILKSFRDCHIIQLYNLPVVHRLVVIVIDLPRIEYAIFR